MKPCTYLSQHPISLIKVVYIEFLIVLYDKCSILIHLEMCKSTSLPLAWIQITSNYITTFLHKMLSNTKTLSTYKQNMTIMYKLQTESRQFSQNIIIIACKKMHMKHTTSLETIWNLLKLYVI